jgi:hypothetical protein
MPCGASLEIGWIPVRKTVDKEDDVHTSDHVDIAVRLLPILEKAHQDQMLREELEQRGWVEQPDGSLTKTFGDVIATLPAGGDAVRIEVAAQRKVKASATAEGRAKEEDIAAQDAVGKRADDAAQTKLDAAKEQARQDLIEENIGRLERVQEQVRREIAEAVTVTTKRSLRTRAAQLGSIQSERETTGEHGLELEIVVRT